MTILLRCLKWVFCCCCLLLLLSLFCHLHLLVQLTLVQVKKLQVGDVPDYNGLVGGRENVIDTEIVNVMCLKKNICF